MTELKPCPTPWCGSEKVHTTTYHKSYKDKDTGEVTRYTEVDHSCPKCHVRTPQLEPCLAVATWNTPSPEADR